MVKMKDGEMVRQKNQKYGALLRQNNLNLQIKLLIKNVVTMIS